MRLKDEMAASGLFRMVVRKDGKVIETMEEHNLIVASAKNQMAHLVGGDTSGRSVTKVAVGTSGTAPAVSNTAITNAYTKAIDSVAYPSSGQVKVSWSLGAAEANGKKILEFGLICADGSLFARRIRSEVLSKESDITVEGEWTISF